MANPFIQIDRPLAATSTAQNIDFGVPCGAYTIYNSDAANGVWCKVNGTPTYGVANGQFYLAPGRGLSIPNTTVTTIGVICDTGLTATVMATGIPMEQV